MDNEVYNRMDGLAIISAKKSLIASKKLLEKHFKKEGFEYWDIKEYLRSLLC